ncbi:MAG: VWA domain-containing protein [Deltaproteobacteria bacterium]|nr:VWA domain-containing protein [Deltaproteobacteria bacterium]
MSNGSSRRGNTTMVFALSMPVILGFTALAIDWGMVSMARLQAQSAADAASLAGAVFFQDPSRAQEVAQAYAEANGINGMDSVIVDDSYVYGDWDTDARTFTALSGKEGANAVRVSVRATVPMHFSAMFGLHAFDVVETAGAGPTAIKGRAPDTVIVLDVSSSMNSTEMRDARTAAQALVDCVAERSSADSRVAVVAHATTSALKLPWTEYGEGYSTISRAISGVVGCGEDSRRCGVIGGTNQSAGLGMGLNLLDQAARTSDDEVGKAIVFLSDGEPHPVSSLCQPSSYEDEVWGDELEVLCEDLEECKEESWTVSKKKCNKYDGPGTCEKVGSKYWVTEEVCETRDPTVKDYTNWADQYKAEAEASGYDIYTVYYGPTWGSGPAFMKDHIVAGNGFALTTPNASDIDSAFVDICVASLNSQPGLLF